MLGKCPTSSPHPWPWELFSKCSVWASWSQRRALLNICAVCCNKNRRAAWKLSSHHQDSPSSQDHGPSREHGSLGSHLVPLDLLVKRKEMRKIKPRRWNQPNKLPFLMGGQGCSFFLLFFFFFLFFFFKASSQKVQSCYHPQTGKNHQGSFPLFHHPLPHCTNGACDIWAPLVCEMNSWEEENAGFAVLGHLLFSFHAEISLSCGSLVSLRATATQCFQKVDLYFSDRFWGWTSKTRCWTVACFCFFVCFSASCCF